MRILFAAPENSWSGFFELLCSDLPGHTFHASGKFSITTLKGYDVLIPAMSEVTEGILKTSDCLKLIQQCGAGLDKVDIEAAARMNIRVANVPSDISGNADSVAELGIYMMIGLSRDVRAIAECFRKRIIGEPAGRSLAGKTVGIIGLGGIGRALIKKLRPFGTTLMGIKRTHHEGTCDEFGLAWSGGPSDLHHLLEMSDFIVLCLPLMPDTRDLMNKESFKHMKRGSFLINLSRGGLVNAGALRDALSSSHIGGAGLDVFWEEPPDPADPIFGFNVIATPHIGGSTDVSLESIRRIVADNIRRLDSGYTPLYVRNTVSMRK